MPYSVVDFRVRVTSTFGTEFPNGPIGTVFVVEELYQGVERIAIRPGRVTGVD